MFRSLFSCASIFVLIITTFFSPAVVSARRCGERLPVTLLALYRSSDFIYVGNFDRVEEGEMTEETEDYRVIPIKKYFSLSSSLKGETKKLLVLDESEYRFKDKPSIEVGASESTETDTEEAANDSASETEEPESVEEEEGETEVDETEVKPGDSVLLFLTQDEDSGELELSDYVDGMKKMTPENLSAYEVRIRELNQIFSRAEPSYTEIVAWMVRCAEDPYTRWEGTYELLQSFQAMDWEAERARIAENKTESQEEPEVVYFGARGQAKQFDTGDVNFAKALTEGEKLLLTNVLLGRERPKQNRSFSSEDTPGMGRGDRELIELVRRWGDTKVAINLIEQLRYDSSDSNLSSDLMGSIASILDDEELGELASRYSDIQWQGEDSEIEDEKAEEAEGDESAAPPENVDVVLPVVESDAAEESTGASEKTDESDPAESDAGPDKVQPKKKTYGEIRGELMKKFLERADRLIADKAKADENRQ